MSDEKLEIRPNEIGLPEVVSQKRGPDVVFATPTFTHSMSVHYHRSLMDSSWLLLAHGISSSVIVRPGDCFVDKARNKLVTDFLREFPDTENFFFIDDDVGWEPHKVLEFVRRPDPVVAGAYPKKGEYRDFPCSLTLNADTGELIESQGLLLAMLAPTGFMRIKRHVLETLAAKSAIFEDITPDGDYASYAYIFENGRGEDGKYWGEDYTFCCKVRDAGFHVWIDPNITFKHQGIKTWEDRLSNHLHVFRDRARSLHAGRDPDSGSVVVDLNNLKRDEIRRGWLDKMLDSTGLLADPATRAKFVDMDQEFWPLYDLCRPYTMTTIERMYDLYKNVEYVVKAGIPGAIAECGVWQGGSMMLIAYALKQCGDESRLLQLFDTFEGLPLPDPTIDIDSLGHDAEAQWKPGWAESGIDEVRTNMARTEYAGPIEYPKGMVEITLAESAVEQYAIVRLDTDWYASTVVELDVLWDRLAPGGLLVIDDYGHWLGVRKAIDDFFAEKPVHMTRPDYSCRVIHKPHPLIAGSTVSAGRSFAEAAE